MSLLSVGGPVGFYTQRPGLQAPHAPMFQQYTPAHTGSDDTRNPLPCVHD